MDVDGHTLGSHVLGELLGHHQAVAELGGVEVFDLHG
jgi:hypothetical protein